MRKREASNPNSVSKKPSWKNLPSVKFSSVAQSCPTLCDPVNSSTPGLPVHRQLPEFTQTHVHQVCDAIQPSHPQSSPSSPALNPSQHQSSPMSQLFTWGGQSTGVSALYFNKKINNHAHRVIPELSAQSFFSTFGVTAFRFQFNHLSWYFLVYLHLSLKAISHLTC